MFLPIQGWEGGYRAGADCADGCERRNANVLVVCGWVFRLGGIEEIGVDEVVVVGGEVYYGAVDGPGGTELAEVGVGVPGCGTTSDRVRVG